MVFKTDILKERLGETRIVNKFLWLPKKLNDEIRWFERVNILQQVHAVDVGGSDQWGYYKHKWVSMEFSNRYNGELNHR